MVADTGSARITGYGSHVNATITGRIYSFTNSDLFTPVMWLSCRYQPQRDRNTLRGNHIRYYSLD